MADPMEEIRATFFEECSELLEQLEAGLLALEAGDQDNDTIDSVFRAVHSIKGGAGAFDLGDLVGFAHCFETVLDGLRGNRLAPTPDVVAVLLRSSDRLGDLVANARDGKTDPAAMPEDLAALADSLTNTDEQVGWDDSSDLDFSPVPIDIDPVAETTQTLAAPDQSRQVSDAPARVAFSGHWRLTFDPLPDLLESGNEPLYLFRALQVLGRIRTEVDESDLPPLEDLDPKVLRLVWTVHLIPTADDLTETEIASVFEFADDLCVLTITAEDSPVAGQSVTDRPAKTPPPATALTQPESLGARGKEKSARSSLSSTIRVDLDRIDRLVNLVGELVISQSMLAQSIGRDAMNSSSASASGLDELQQLTRDIQDSVMAIRAQPVRSLFQRMTRIVREAAQLTEKNVRMITDGETTEIDKTVVERLADPLTHMIRNAIDHGLESPEARAAAGKPPTGTVHLRARQQSDRVIIEVGDDGRGIDRAKVLKRALERNLVPADRHLDPYEIDRLLFLPGFSTNEEVSALSGRGVGMDVVHRAIRDLNGTIAISSTEGVGCTISISLPLTLAILDGMIVRTARQRMVIPLSAIIETQTVTAARIEPMGAGQLVVKLQDRFVPLIDLAEGMGFSTDRDSAEVDDDSALLFVQPEDMGPFALRVDAIEAQRQVVIKGLGDSFGRIPCVSAATILGDGQVALIVDPGGLMPSGSRPPHSDRFHQEVRMQ
ncbi:chemotaxis protein CheA [Jannaschia sp. M317]|uniref:chemotaxis protein CheA n=1 Tax=Jannaschia sp. M317 TaxID=2867011 RepID=UPI0021A2AD88|nr:chemotaxis protein CheA [Jannaschia sp. M317]UWQ16749.1 chemotaxis protein CheA [Jannaschia sp. M317]